jgi:hypothetical protein
MRLGFAGLGAFVVLLSGLAPFSIASANAQVGTAATAPIPSAPAGQTILNTKVVNGTDRVTNFVGSPTSYFGPIPAAITPNDVDPVGSCREITATAVYDAPVGRLWSYTSFAIWCSTATKVTRLFWEAPEWTITSNGTLAGWHYKGHSHSTHVVSAKLRTGTDVGHFKRYYNVCVFGKCIVTNLGSQDATHHVWVSPNSHGWS